MDLHPLMVLGYMSQTSAGISLTLQEHNKMETMTLKRAVEESGKISLGNTKMPSTTFAISAKHCHVGGKLINIKGSTCSRCYAFKLQNLRPSVDKGWTNNLFKAVKMIKENPNLWAKMVAFQIERACKKLDIFEHRWFDSGDLQSVEMLRAIVLCAQITPKINHWLPTREAKIVKEYRKQFGQEPSNLVIRVSATMIGDKPIKGHENTSTVHRKGEAIYGKECLAYRTNKDSKIVPLDDFKAMTRQEKKAQDFGHCGDCRACWSKDVENISYPLH
jgi:hypothetical protein